MSFVKIYQASVKVLGKWGGYQWNLSLQPSILDPGAIVGLEVDSRLGFCVDVHPSFNEIPIVHLEDIRAGIYQNLYPHTSNRPQQRLLRQALSFQGCKDVLPISLLQEVSEDFSICLTQAWQVVL